MPDQKREEVTVRRVIDIRSITTVVGEEKREDDSGSRRP